MGSSNGSEILSGDLTRIFLDFRVSQVAKCMQSISGGNLWNQKELIGSLFVNNLAAVKAECSNVWIIPKMKYLGPT